MAVQARAVGSEQDRTLAALTHGQIDRPGGPGSERNRDHLASLAGNGERSVSALERQAFDVGADGLRHPEAVEAQQRDERMVPGSGQTRRHQQRSAPTSLRSSPTAWDS